MTKAAVSFYVKFKLNPEKNAAKQSALENYLFQLHVNDSSTELALFDLFAVPLFPILPIDEEIANLPISFIYGEFDWVV